MARSLPRRKGSPKFIRASRPFKTPCTASPGIAKLICVLTIPATATPTTLPWASTTGPPEFPGFMPPLTWTRSRIPCAFLRRLETADVLTVMFLPSDSPKGKPQTQDCQVRVTVDGGHLAGELLLISLAAVDDNIDGARRWGACPEHADDVGVGEHDTRCRREEPASRGHARAGQVNADEHGRPLDPAEHVRGQAAAGRRRQDRRRFLRGRTYQIAESAETGGCR